MKNLVSAVLFLLLSGQICIAAAKYQPQDGSGARNLVDCVRDIINGLSSAEDVLFTSIKCKEGILYVMNDMPIDAKARDLASAIFEAILSKNKEESSSLFDELAVYLGKESEENIGSEAKNILDVYRAAKNKPNQLRKVVVLIVSSGQFAEPTAKWALKVGQYSGPVMIIAELGEYGLVHLGYKREGQAVGAVGNTASGAMLGFSMGGPPGAAVGGIIGLGMWWWTKLPQQNGWLL